MTYARRTIRGSIMTCVICTLAGLVALKAPRMASLAPGAFILDWFIFAWAALFFFIAAFYALMAVYALIVSTDERAYQWHLENQPEYHPPSVIGDAVRACITTGTRGRVRRQRHVS